MRSEDEIEVQIEAALAVKEQPGLTTDHIHAQAVREALDWVLERG
jgi:hypothetical protein